MAARNPCRHSVRITLNRPEVINAIDDEVPALLSQAVDERARGGYDWTGDPPRAARYIKGVVKPPMALNNRV